MTGYGGTVAGFRCSYVFEIENVLFVDFRRRYREVPKTPKNASFLGAEPDSDQARRSSTQHPSSALPEVGETSVA